MSTAIIRNESYRGYKLHTEDYKMDLDNTLTKSRYKDTLTENKEESKMTKLLNTIKSKRITKAQKAEHSMRLKEVERSQDRAREFYHYNTFNR